MIMLEGKKIVVAGVSENSFSLSFSIRNSSSCANNITGGGRGISLAFCKAIIEAGGDVGILDILTEPSPNCRALVEKGGRCDYFQ